jgi:hypothetical protein
MYRNSPLPRASACDKNQERYDKKSIFFGSVPKLPIQMVSPSVENMSMSLDVHKSILETEKTLKTFTSGLGFF